MKTFADDAEKRRIAEAWSRGIQRGRLMQRLTQSELARRAGVTVTTIYRAEKGLPVRESSFRKVCEALNIKFDEFLKMKPVFDASREPYIHHRGTESYWYAPVDHRRMVPEDDQALVQDPRERLRLGRVGLVPAFVCYPGFVMPEGPGATLVELYGRYEHAFNPFTYRDGVLYGQRGTSRLGIRDDVLELAEGDMIGYASADLRWIEPAQPLGPEGQPSLAFWFGAVRLGRIVAPPGKRTIIRTARPEA